jgi:hypothetical protein
VAVGLLRTGEATAYELIATAQSMNRPLMMNVALGYYVEEKRRKMRGRNWPHFYKAIGRLNPTKVATGKPLPKLSLPLSPPQGVFLPAQ